MSVRVLWIKVLLAFGYMFVIVLEMGASNSDRSINDKEVYPGVAQSGSALALGARGR